MAFKLAELFVAISVEGVTNLNKKVDKTRRNVAKLGQSFKALGSKITGVGTQFLKFGAVIAAPLILGIRQFAKLGDELAKMSKRTGVAVNELSRLAFATSQSGASIKTLEIGIRGMQRQIIDLARGLTTAKDNFDDLGISIGDIQGLTTSEQFGLIADALSKVEDPTTRAALAMKIFGRSGSELLPFLADGSAGIKKLGKEAERLGLTFDDEAAAKAEVLTDALDKLARVVNAVFFAIGAALSESVTNLADRITKTITSVIEWVRENETLIKVIGAVALGVTLLGGTLVVLGLAIKAVGIALTFLAANPIGAVITVVALVVLAILAWIGVFSDLDNRQQETQKEMKKTVAEMKKQKEEIDKLREGAKKPIVIKTEIEKPAVAIAKADQVVLRTLKIEPDIDTKKIKKKLKEKPFEIKAVFSGIESLFRNAQETFAENKGQKENTKKTEENTKALKDNTKAIGKLSNVSGKIGGTQQTFMLPLGS